MNKKLSKINEINEVNAIISSMPTLTEALAFDDYNESNQEDDIDDDNFIDNSPSSEKIGNAIQKDIPNGDKYTSLVNNIRKMALEGMSELADDVNNNNYQILKKIWQFCEKKPDEDKKYNENNKI